MSDGRARRVQAAAREGTHDDVLAELDGDARRRAALLAAVVRAEAGALADASRLVDVALAGAPPSVLLEAAPLRFALGACSAALRSLREVGDDPALAPVASRVRLELVRPAGLDRDLVAALDEVLAERPDDRDLLAQAATVHRRARSWHAALRLAERHLALGQTTSMLLLRAELLIELGRYGEAIDSVERVLALEVDGDRESRSTAHAIALLLRAGAVERGEELLRDAEARFGSTADTLAERARLRLFHGDPEGAIDLAERALARVPGHGAALRARGAAALLEGRDEDAAVDLDRAVSSAPNDAEGHAHRAELLLRAGDEEGTRSECHAALACGDGFNPSVWMIRLVSELRDDLGNEVRGRKRRPDEPSTDAHGRADEVEEVLVELFPDVPGVVDEAVEDLSLLVARLEEGLRRMRGNRSSTPTFVHQGRLVPIRSRTSPRELSRWALELIRVARPQAVLDAFDRVVERFPRSSMPVVHRGELHLWLGDTARARADFEAARRLDRGTRWAYIGLSGVCILEGDLDGALAINAEGVRIKRSAIGSIFVYRGEAYRRLGRLDEARSDLEEACRLHPTRIGAWMNLALCADAQGDHGVGVERFAQAWIHAPVLLADAAEAAGVEVSTILDGVPPPELRKVILDSCLRLMRGNRSSSCQTYFTADGWLRVLSKPDLADSEGRFHARRKALLAGLRRRYARSL